LDLVIGRFARMPVSLRAKAATNPISGKAVAAMNGALSGIASEMLRGHETGIVAVSVEFLRRSMGSNLTYIMLNRSGYLSTTKLRM